MLNLDPYLTPYGEIYLKVQKKKKKKHILYDSIYIKLKTKTNHGRRQDIYLAGIMTGKGPDSKFPELAMFYFLIWVMIIWLYSLYKNVQICSPDLCTFPYI